MDTLIRANSNFYLIEEALSNSADNRCPEHLLFTIIVPIFNTEISLDRCINSPLCQTFNRCEILLIIDGSTDNSCNISRFICKSR